MNSGTIRPATHDDLPRLLALASQRRADYERAQPQFWRQSADAIERQRPYFARQLAASPVYNPGGDTCLVDDFTVADPAAWPTLGATQLVVISGHHDAPKRAMLATSNHAIVSEWWLTPLTP